MASNTSVGQDGSSTSSIGDGSGLSGLVNISALSESQLYCYLQSSSNEYNGDLGARVSAVFVILVVSSAVTFFPVLATRSKRLKIPLYVYLFARYFGAGVIVATAFIHLLDPAYAEIGPATCVGSTGNWAVYSWPPAICLFTCMLTFLLDFAAERYVEKKYGLAHGNTTENAQQRQGSVDAAMLRYDFAHRPSTAPSSTDPHATHQHLHSGDQDQQIGILASQQTFAAHNSSSGGGGGGGGDDKALGTGEMAAHSSNDDDHDHDHDHEHDDAIDAEKEAAAERGFKQQIAAFLILEFGVIFHSVIIGLTLGTAGPEFAVLYPVIVFHQSFEGLGIGARLSAIPFPRRLRWMPWWLCAGYGFTTPIAIAIGLGVRTTYNAGSFIANVVSGVLDSTSAGILVYTGLVELLARDFLFNPDRTNDDRQLAFMLFSVMLGAGLMALLGKWA